ncbi:hypothetical protein [Mycobacterium sp.]|uniref:hypothetical protein n=1 Tax=Mycobacterium sp. TaxID=1785 RepID=UPI003D1017F3
MAPLTPADVKRWDADAIHSVFQTAINRAASLQTLGDNLQQVHSKLSDWQGEAGDAFRAELNKTRHDIEADGHESKQIAAAVARAEADVRAVKADLGSVEQSAETYGFTITPDWQIDSGAMKLDSAKALFKEQLQVLLDSCKLHAHSADQELATAVRSAVGDIASTAGPPPAPAGNQPKSREDVLLPVGPGSRDPAKGPPVPGDVGAVKPPSLEDMMLGRGTPAHQKPPPGSPLDLLSRVPPGATGVPAPPLKPAEIESFKAMARQTKISDGVPPDQVEARLNAVVANTQQWLAAGAPNYVAPQGPRPPAPGFGEGFGDRWNATMDAVHDLTGQNGLGAMGDAWGGMAKGLGQKAEDYLMLGPVAPLKDGVQQFKSFLDNPAYYAGERGADVAMNAPMMMFGGEAGALRAGLGDIGPGVLDTGPAVSTEAAMGFEHPMGYNPWAEQAASDLNYGHWHGGPTGALSEPVADMSTHYVGDNPDRVVLGKFNGPEGGYIGEARGNGGIYFDTGDPTWDALTRGFGPNEEKGLVWQVNEHFLRNQMESAVPRIEYVLPDGFDSVEQLAGAQRQSYSAMEINFLKNNAAAYGYEQQGNVWVYAGR